MNPTRLRSHNLVATFPDGPAAEEARAALEQAGFEAQKISVAERVDREGSLRGESREEAEHMVGLPTLVLTRSMTRGAVWGTLLGAVAGGLLFLPFSFVDFGFTFPTRLLVLGVIGATAGATAGFVYYGARRAQLDETAVAPAADRGITVAVHSDDEADVSHAAEILEPLHPERLDRVGADGRPV